MANWFASKLKSSNATIKFFKKNKDKREKKIKKREIKQKWKNNQASKNLF